MSPDFSQRPDPKLIYQEHLDALSSALMSGDFAAFAARIHLPLRVITETSENLMETEVDLAQAFYMRHRSLAAQAGSEFVRLVTDAHYVTDTVICGAHESHVLLNGQRMVPPYGNRLRLQNKNGVWGEIIAANAILNDSKRMVAPKVSRNPTVPAMPKFDPERT